MTCSTLSLELRETYSLLLKPKDPLKITVKMKEEYKKLMWTQESLPVKQSPPPVSSSQIQEEKKPVRDREGYLIDVPERMRRCENCQRVHIMMITMDGSPLEDYSLCQPCYLAPILDGKYNMWRNDLISKVGKHNKHKIPGFDQWKAARLNGSLDQLLMSKGLSLER